MYLAYVSRLCILSEGSFLLKLVQLSDPFFSSSSSSTIYFEFLLCMCYDLPEYVLELIISADGFKFCVKKDLKDGKRTRRRRFHLIV